MTKLKLSDLKNVIEEDLPYSLIVDYLRFLHAFGRGTKVSPFDDDVMVALHVDNPQHASQKLAALYLNEFLRREVGRSLNHGRKPFQYYAPK